MRRSNAAKWIAAMEEEKSAFFTNGTWEIVPTHHTWNLLSSKWVFKIKVDENGAITRYRACLVAKGFLQREGVDGDIFSSSPLLCDIELSDCCWLWRLTMASTRATSTVPRRSHRRL
jgi:hypothetical protein